jgi:hypothetical protein
MKRVVCMSVVRNVGTFGEHQNDHVVKQRFLVVSGGRGVNIVKVTNLLVLMKMMWQVHLILKTCAEKKLFQ